MNELICLKEELRKIRKADLSPQDKKQLEEILEYIIYCDLENECNKIEQVLWKMEYLNMFSNAVEPMKKIVANKKEEIKVWKEILAAIRLLDY